MVRKFLGIATLTLFIVLPGAAAFVLLTIPGVAPLLVAVLLAFLGAGLVAGIIRTIVGAKVNLAHVPTLPSSRGHALQRGHA